jgi:hypothetical protein
VLNRLGHETVGLAATTRYSVDPQEREESAARYPDSQLIRAGSPTTRSTGVPFAEALRSHGEPWVTQIHDDLQRGSTDLRLIASSRASVRNFLGQTGSVSNSQGTPVRTCVIGALSRRSARAPLCSGEPRHMQIARCTGPA